MYYFRPHYTTNAIRIYADDDSAWVLDEVRHVDGDESLMMPEDPKIPCLTMHIVHLGDGRYRVTMDGHKDIETGHPLYIALALIKNDSIMDPAYFGLHAATAEVEGTVCTFTAATGTGKTSLAAYLCARGAKLYGDDLTLIRRDSLEVYPTYKPIMLREPSLNLLKGYGIDLTKSTIHVSDGEYDRFMDADLPMADMVKPMKMLFVIHVDKEHRIERVEDERQRMKLIMINAMKHEKFSMQYLAFIQSMTRLPMYEVWYQDFDWLWEQICSLSSKRGE